MSRESQIKNIVSSEAPENVMSALSRLNPPYDNNNKADRAAFEAANATRYASGNTNQNNPPSDKKPNPVVQTIKELLQAQESGQQIAYNIEGELKNVKDLYNVFYDENNQRKAFSLSGVTSSIFSSAKDAFVQYGREQTYMLEEINQKTSLTGELSEHYRDTLTRAQPELLRLGIGTRDLVESGVRLVENSGRFNLINRETFIRAGAVAKAYVGTLEGLVNMFPEFEKIGYGAADASEKISYAGQMSLRLGLNAKKTVTDLQSSLGKMNEYGFKNGIEGLTRMVQKATEFRMSMNEVFKIADKVMSPEGAVELSANLQVLGGAIGAFNDPLKLMYMSTNNVEGLQDALINAAGGLATYNSETKKFELSGVNLRRAKEMAAQLGVEYGELAKGAIAAAERTQAADDLMSRGLTLDESQKEFITNLATMKDGKMTIELQSEFLRDKFNTKELKLDQLSEEQKQMLLQYQEEFKKMDEKDIIQNQYTAVENIKRDVNFLAAVVKLKEGKLGEAAGKITGFSLKDVAEITKDLSEEGAKSLTNLGKDVQDALQREGIVDIQGKYEEQWRKKIEEKEKSQYVKEEKNANETKTVNTKNEHYIYIKSDDNVDAVNRQKFYKGEYVIGNNQ